VKVPCTYAVELIVAVNPAISGHVLQLEKPLLVSEISLRLG